MAALAAERARSEALCLRFALEIRGEAVRASLEARAGGGGVMLWPTSLDGAPPAVVVLPYVGPHNAPPAGPFLGLGAVPDAPPRGTLPADGRGP